MAWIGIVYLNARRNWQLWQGWILPRLQDSGLTVFFRPVL